MKLEHRDLIPANADQIYGIVKNQLPDLVPYLPSVQKIELLEHKILPNNKEQIINHWFADIDIPSILTKFINKDLLSWKDTAIWDPKNLKVDYTLESFIANDLFEATGCNQFIEKNQNEMELLVSCEVLLNADKIPGVPKLMKKTVTPIMEGLIEKMIQPNLKSLGQGLKLFLSEKSSS